MYDGGEGKSTISRTDLVHGSENVVDFLVEFMAKLRIDVCVDHTRPGLVLEIRRLMDALIDAKKAGKNKIHHRNYKLQRADINS